MVGEERDGGMGGGRVLPDCLCCGNDGCCLGPAAEVDGCSMAVHSASKFLSAKVRVKRGFSSFLPGGNNHAGAVPWLVWLAGLNARQGQNYLEPIQ